MEPHPPPSTAAMSEEALHALADGRLGAAERRALEAQLAGDPQARATLEAWQRQREALRGLHGTVLEAPLPAPLRAAAAEFERQRAQWHRWWGRGAIAASVALAFVAGWALHGRLAPSSAGSLAASSTGAREFIHQASVAHLVYAPEQRHPVEVGAAQQEHLVQWLSKRLARPLKVPDLHALGYELVGGRLLPGSEGARAQFMFQNAAGERVTLYLGAMQQGTPDARPGSRPAPAQGEIAFRFSAEGPVPSFYWVEQGFGYALAGNLPRERLLQIAEQVYRQL